jgi:glycosidase
MAGVEWFKDAVIYQIFIDRFCGFKSSFGWDKPEFIGGNIKGIISKLDYIKKLGFNTIWISPFLKTNEYHGYHVTDFFKVDEYFGTLDDIKSLVKKCHDSGMRIICDFVPNHLSFKHPYFLEAQKNKESKYFKWFYFKNWPNDYVCFLHYKEIPKINLDYPPAREHIITCAKWLVDLGFDGFRLDHAIGPSHSFWKEFRREIKSVRSDVVLIGEVWAEGIKKDEIDTLRVNNRWFYKMFGIESERLFKEYIKEFDGLLDFKFNFLIKEFLHRHITESEFNKLLEKHYKKYPKDFFLLTFLDNHDMNRILFECGNDKEKLKKLIEIQFSVTQPAIVYYGTENAMTQDMPVSGSYADLFFRQPFDWNKTDYELCALYKVIIEKRK